MSPTAGSINAYSEPSHLPQKDLGVAQESACLPLGPLEADGLVLSEHYLNLQWGSEVKVGFLQP